MFYLQFFLFCYFRQYISVSFYVTKTIGPLYSRYQITFIKKEQWILDYESAFPFVCRFSIHCTDITFCDEDTYVYLLSACDQNKYVINFIYSAMSKPGM